MREESRQRKTEKKLKVFELFFAEKFFMIIFAAKKYELKFYPFGKGANFYGVKGHRTLSR